MEAESRFVRWQMIQGVEDEGGGDWEALDMWRTPVPGGWLVAFNISPSPIFLPDPEHKWLTEQDKEEETAEKPAQNDQD